MNYEKLCVLSDEKLLAAGRRLSPPYGMFLILALAIGFAGALYLDILGAGLLTPVIGRKLAGELSLVGGTALSLLAVGLVVRFTEFHGATAAAFMPLSQNPRACLKAQELVEQHEGCRAIRDRVLRFGRQLYVFDLDAMEIYVRQLEDTEAEHRAKSACRSLHGIPEQVS